MKRGGWVTELDLPAATHVFATSIPRSSAASHRLASPDTKTSSLSLTESAEARWSASYPRRAWASARDPAWLTSAAVLRPVGRDWQVDAVAGQPIPQRPEEAMTAVELSDHRVLAFLAEGPSALDKGLIDAFVAELHHAMERSQLERLRLPDGPSSLGRR